MKIFAFLAILALATSCNSSVTSNPTVSRLREQHEQIVALQKQLNTQSIDLDIVSATKLTNIVDESTDVIKELNKLDISKWQESEQLGLVNVLAIKESILLLSAQQIPKHATFFVKN